SWISGRTGADRAPLQLRHPTFSASCYVSFRTFSDERARFVDSSELQGEPERTQCLFKLSGETIPAVRIDVQLENVETTAINPATQDFFAAVARLEGAALSLPAALSAHSDHSRLRSNSSAKTNGS